LEGVAWLARMKAEIKMVAEEQWKRMVKKVAVDEALLAADA
jgi:hypothetical protein